METQELRKDRPAILVPSKGRPDGTAFKFLERYLDLYDVFIAVEKEDYPVYKDSLSNKKFIFLVLEESNQGIGYSKMFSMEFLHREGYEHCYIIDDDLKGMRKRIAPKKYVKLEDCDNPFLDGLKFFVDNHLSMMAFSHVFGIRYSEDEYKLNSVVSQFVLVRVPDIIELGNYDRSLRLYEDMDMHFKTVLSGRKALKWMGYTYDMPPDTAASPGVGGCSDEYKARMHQFMDYMEAIYPKIVTSSIRKNLRRFRVSWKTLYEIAEMLRKEEKT